MPTTDKRHRVLVVDDNQDGANALGLLVEELGNQVHVTYGGTKALEVATAFQPDLMLVDYHLDQGDGLASIAQIRAKFPRAKVDHSTDQVFQLTLVRTPKRPNSRGRITFGVSTQTHRTTFIGVPFIAFCE